MTITPELIILIAAVACLGSCVVIYFNRSSAVASGIAVISFIAVLYGFGQRAQRDDVEVNSQGFVDAARDRTKTPEAPAVPQRQAEVIANAPAAPLQLPQPTNLNALGAPSQVVTNPKSPAVTISNFATYQISADYVELSGKVVNGNEFPIKNIVVKCGDTTFATADVSVTLDKIMPAKSDLYISKVRMGPIRPHMPPNTCTVAKFERAN